MPRFGRGECDLAGGVRPIAQRTPSPSRGSRLVAAAIVARSVVLLRRAERLPSHREPDPYPGNPRTRKNMMSSNSSRDANADRLSRPHIAWLRQRLTRGEYLGLELTLGVLLF